MAEADASTDWLKGTGYNLTNWRVSKLSALSKSVSLSLDLGPEKRGRRNGLARNDPVTCEE